MTPQLAFWMFVALVLLIFIVWTRMAKYDRTMRAKYGDPDKIAKRNATSDIKIAASRKAATKSTDARKGKQ